MVRRFYFSAGLLFVGLAFVGAVLPIMPSAIFVILAAGCFARSSPRFEAWLLDHKLFGPSLRAWRRHGAILPKAKAASVGGMVVGFFVFWALARPGLALALLVAAFFAASAWFILSRPSGPHPD